MKSSLTLPGLLAFGPQASLPPQGALDGLREQLTSNPILLPLHDAVENAFEFWEMLVDNDASLSTLPGANYLRGLKKWIAEGGSFPIREGNNVPNVLALPITVLFQITQYFQYLSSLGIEDAHAAVLESTCAGVQGFCVGFLSACVVASSKNESELASIAAVSFRLAICIGAYVDKDGDSVACLALRWNDANENAEKEVLELLHNYPEAYVSSITDDACLTVTARDSDLINLSERAKALGLRVKTVDVRGRFHTNVHEAAAKKIIELSSTSRLLQLPKTTSLRLALRSTVDGELIKEGSLTQHALDHTLLRPARWYHTLRASLSTLPEEQRSVIFAGFGNHIPASLVQTSKLQVFSLSSLSGLDGKNRIDTLPVSQENTSNASIHDDTLSQYPSHAIAIVGMSGRFPGADSVEELWELLLAGKTMAEPADVERLNLPQDGDYVNTKWWGNFLRDSESFDHKFFKKSSREAVAWDPQQRILLEVIYEALEASGYFGASSATQPDDYGCYIGAVMNNYYDNVSCHPATAYATLGTSRCFLSGCMSHYFGWTGPSLTIDTACSSSLVAINTACRAIWSGECSRAIAGGTNVICSPFDYQNLHAAGFLSPSGQCKPFDAGADGYCRGEGVAAVVLKPLADALKENDNILGVVVGSAANQNYNLSHVTVPHSGSQVNLYQKVMEMGNVTPESVTYVEAHGTGTGVGDPVEVRSIRDAFGVPTRDSLLHFGSIKGNIGHTEATAGIAGLVKVLLMMQHGQIPAQASHNTINPKIPSFDQHRMAIPRSILPWTPDTKLALINSYGAAGSNSAVMIREAPSISNKRTSTELSKYPVFLSAATSNSLATYSQKLLEWINEFNAPISDVAFNLADRANHVLSHTFSTTVRGIDELKSKLQDAASASGIVNNTSAKPVVLVFGGQESDFIGLSQDVYNSSSIFRSHLDECNKILASLGVNSFYPEIFQQDPISDLVTLHSALFAVQYASAQAWIDSGLDVSAVIGHSFGQLTALAVSGALSIKDALKLVSGRASLMQKHWGSEPGSMIFVQANEPTVSEILSSVNSEGEYAEIACYNGPKSHVVVGSSKAIDALEKHVAASPSLRDTVRTKKLKVTNGFHSMFTEPLLPHISSLSEQLTWREPSVHLELCDETGGNDQPSYQLAADHTRRPVYFQRAVERLTQRFQKATWLEVGRGSSVTQLVRGSVNDVQGHSFLSPQLTVPNAQASLTDVTVDLWKAGYATQYWPFHRSQKQNYKYLSLPPYQFEKTRHWLPFTGRGTEKEEEPSRVEEIPETHELLSFVQFKENTKESTFRIDPLAARFKTMLGGHVMAGQTLAPASLYFEVVARAALFLHSDIEAKTYVPTVDDLVMNSPIGQSTRNILLTLKRSDDLQPSWSWTITSQADAGAGGRVAAPFVQSTGRVNLTRRDDAQAAQNFKRFETLTGYRRYQEIVNHPDAEKMQGNHIYRAFNHIVHYAENFRGIKQVSCMKMEAAGKVIITPEVNDPADQRLCDTPMTDSFMQFAGFLVNYFNNPSLEDVLVCHKIEHIEIGGAFNPDAKEWIVYSNMTEGGDADAMTDAYVFEAESKKMVLAAFGFHFSKMSQALLARMLKTVNKTDASATASTKPSAVAIEQAIPEVVTTDAPTTAVVRSSSKRSELLQVLSNVTDIPLEELTDESTLDDLGIDSLMATEVLNDIRSVLGLTIDLTSFLFFPNIAALAAHVDEKLGVGGEEVSGATTRIDTPAPQSEGSDSGIEIEDPIVEKKLGKPLVTPISSTTEKSDVCPTITSAYDAFQETRYGYDQLATGTKATNFWSEAYPHQARLVLAYIVETYAKLGCDMGVLKPGDAVPRINALPRHKQLVDQFYRVLEDGKLISSTGNGSFVRTEKELDTTAAEDIYTQIIDLHPQHATVNRLVRAVGSQMAACLVGDIDGLQIVFGNKENKKTLEDMYEFWPLLRTPTLLLGDFLTKAFTNATGGGGKFRVLEIGAGTGGTTRYVVNHLKSHGIPFEYTFTDISSSLVGAAKRQFKGVEGMKFEVLDVEKPPKKEYENEFHVIIATNCIHATRNLNVSLKHLRQMLRDDGALTLVEITQNMFWLDVVVGLFEGWWLFEDGRSHALIDEKRWEGLMKKAGFKEVLWSDGAAPESKTVRVIGAFPSTPQTVLKGGAKDGTKKNIKAALETVVYKTIGSQEIHADVYYPVEPEQSKGKKPVALMIHGGSHIIFSRKDIRPAQTRLLLEKGFIPVSLDHRLCPEVSLQEGPMVDVCDALHWARHTLPNLKLQQPGLQIDGERVVVVGWSSGGQLAMSLAWTAPQRGLRPPEAILAFYCPTNYEDPWWKSPIQPIGAEDKGENYNILDGIQSSPITNYGVVGAWEPLSDPRIRTDPRCRIVLHINWKAQTLPVIIGGHFSKSPSTTTSSSSSSSSSSQVDEVVDYNTLPQPPLSRIIPVSPRAQIERGNYNTPTFMVHGTADDLIPWEQSRGTYEELVKKGVETGLALVEGAPHICDLSSDVGSEGWKAAVRGYEFLFKYV